MRHVAHRGSNVETGVGLTRLGATGPIRRRSMAGR
jgi:hypothetical protein